MFIAVGWIFTDPCNWIIVQKSQYDMTSCIHLYSLQSI